MDRILETTADWLMPVLPWFCRPCSRDVWLHGFVRGIAVGGVLGALSMFAAVIVLWILRKAAMLTKRFAIWLAALSVALLVAIPADAQQAREEKTDSLTYHGVPANAQTLPENHTMNRNPNIPGWGGCVPSAARTAALHAGIPRDRIDHFWEIAQKRVGVGGTGPELLAAMLYEAYGQDEPWISYLSSNPDEVRATLDKLSAKGYCISGTMGWGAPELYGNRRIAHWVNYPHFSSSDNLACVEDNNDPPGVYRWMTATEGLARCMSGGQAWIHAFTREHPVIAAVTITVLLCVAAMLLLASALVLMCWFFTLIARPRPSLCT